MFSRFWVRSRGLGGVANVIPLFTKGAREGAGNYRSVGLTSKMHESITKDVVAAHLDSRTGSVWIYEG